MLTAQFKPTVCPCTCQQSSSIISPPYLGHQGRPTAPVETSTPSLAWSRCTRCPVVNDSCAAPAPAPVTSWLPYRGTVDSFLLPWEVWLIGTLPGSKQWQRWDYTCWWTSYRTKKYRLQTEDKYISYLRSQWPLICRTRGGASSFWQLLVRRRCSFCLTRTVVFFPSLGYCNRWSRCELYLKVNINSLHQHVDLGNKRENQPKELLSFYKMKTQVFKKLLL